MDKVLVVVRHLPNSRPVAHMILHPNDFPLYEAFKLKAYMEQAADRKIKKFKEQFAEFNEAQFYKDWVETSDSLSPTAVDAKPVYKMCKHCKAPVVFERGAWRATPEPEPGTGQYCWIDPVHGSQLHKVD